MTGMPVCGPHRRQCALVRVDGQESPTARGHVADPPGLFFYGSIPRFPFLVRPKATGLLHRLKLPWEALQPCTVSWWHASQPALTVHARHADPGGFGGLRSLRLLLCCADEEHRPTVSAILFHSRTLR